MTIVCNDIKAGQPAYPLLPEVEQFNLNGTGKNMVPPRIKICREICRPLQQLGFPYLFDRVNETRACLFTNRLERVIDKIRPDVILPFSVDELMTLTTCRNAKHIPIVQMLHYLPKKAIGPPSRIRRKALNKAACVQVLLESFVHDTRKLCDSEIVVIPNSVPQSERHISYREKDSYRIVNLARLQRGKQPHILIDAFALLAEEFPNWTLHFYGDDQGSNFHLKLEKQICRLKLEKRVFLEGVTKQPEETLLSGDIFGFPSAREGFSIALLEAMRTGLPPVGFRSAPSVNELIRDEENGLLAEDGAAGMAAALRRLMGSAELRRRLGENARAFAAQYTPEKIWDRWETLLVRVISQNQAERRQTSESRV